MATEQDEAQIEQRGQSAEETSRQASVEAAQLYFSKGPDRSGKALQQFARVLQYINSQTGIVSPEVFGRAFLSAAESNSDRLAEMNDLELAIREIELETDRILDRLGARIERHHTELDNLLSKLRATPVAA